MRRPSFHSLPLLVLGLTACEDGPNQTYAPAPAGAADYDVTLDKNGQPLKTGELVIKAVETTDFLGNVFLCRDAPTSDILHVEMYTPVATILDWLAAHPGAYQACQIIIRYSPYGNYADYLTALTNGVRLGITQGGGFGRVVDVTLFTPGVHR